MPEVSKAVADLTVLMDLLLAKLDRLVAWRRNFTIAVSILVLILGAAIWNNNRVQQCNQSQIQQRSIISSSITRAEETLWSQIEQLTRDPKGHSFSRQHFFADIDRYRSEEERLLSDPISSCSWF